MLPRFFDLSTIPEGLQTLRQGKDPLVTNPNNPMGLPYNYPRIWLYLFSALRINVENVWAIAIPLCACYLICMSLLIAQAKHVEDVFLLLFASLSIAPMLALERGNIDLSVFSLTFLSCATTNRYAKSLALGAASVLKLFPFAGMVIEAVRRPAKQRMLPFLFAGLVLVLFAWQWRDINLIRHATPIARSRSYGVLSLQAEITYLLSASLSSSIPMGWIVAVGFWLVVLSLLGLAWKAELDLDPALFNSPQGEMFSVFGAIYVFTYAIGSNWDYRLMFLLPTIPFALELIRMAQFKRWAGAYLILVVLAENASGLEGHGGTPLGHLATFLLFMLIVVVLTQQAKSLVSAPAFSASLALGS
jgi:hypothetical protein